MEIVLGFFRLNKPGGAEHYTLTAAEQLQRLGHGVTILVEEVGQMAELARRRGLRVTAVEGVLPDDADVLYAQETMSAYRLAARYPGVPLAYHVHAVDFVLSVPPQVPDIVSAVVTMHDRVERQARALGVQAPIVRLRQPVDLERFSPRGSLRQPPRRVLALGNYLHGDRDRVLDDACSETGLELVRIGVHRGNDVLESQAVLNDTDIVVGKARVIVEAMACGRAAYVYDVTGSDGWVTPESYPRLAADNFSGQTGTPAVDLDRFRSDLSLYRPDMGVANRELAIVNHSANRHAVELVELFQSLAPARTPVGAPLREMGRLVRLQWQTEERAFGLAGEARVVREELQRVQQRAAELEQEAARVPQLEQAAAQVPLLEARIRELEQWSHELEAGIHELEAGIHERDAGIRELEAAHTKSAEALQHVLRQRRVQLGIALARPLDLFRRRRR